jgi:hypothetical protein
MLDAGRAGGWMIVAMTDFLIRGDRWIKNWIKTSGAFVASKQE